MDRREFGTGGIGGAICGNSGACDGREVGGWSRVAGGDGMRVLQLGKFYDPVVGGMESALREMCETMREQVEVRVVVANTRMRTEHEMREVATRVASLGKLWSCSMAPAYPLWARKFEADVMHVHVPNPL